METYYGTTVDLRYQNIELNTFMKACVGSGTSTLFWMDWWIGNGPLKDMLPPLYNIVRVKMCTLSDRWEDGYGDESRVWDWFRPVQKVTRVSWCSGGRWGLLIPCVSMGLKLLTIFCSTALLLLRCGKDWHLGLVWACGGFNQGKDWQRKPYRWLGKG